MHSGINVTLVNFIVYIDGEKRVMKYHNDKSIDEADGEQDGMPSGYVYYFLTCLII